MNKEDHFFLGLLLKTTGVKGEIILKLNNDCSDEILELGSIFIIIDDKLVPFFIEEIRIKSSSTTVVKIEGFDTEEESSEFIGCEFYISNEQAKKLKIELTTYIDVKGYRVKDQNMSLIGEVIEFVDISQNPLLNVRTSEGEVLIPANDELIIEVDDDLKEIQLNIATGLFDID